MTNPITNNDDFIDSRDIVDRINELERRASDEDEIYPLDEDELEEYVALRALAKEAEEYAEDWSTGATFISSEYFTEYTKALADDIGAIDNASAHWPLNHIDWDEAAEELKQDYTEYTFDGVAYYAR